MRKAAPPTANLTRLSHSLDDLNARVRTEVAAEGLPFAHDAHSLGRATVWHLVTDPGDLDLAMLPSGTQGFEDLRRNAIAVEILGAPTRVAALADIIRSKEATGREKDRAALPMLRRLQTEIERRDPNLNCITVLTRSSVAGHPPLRLCYLARAGAEDADVHLGRRDMPTIGADRAKRPLDMTGPLDRCPA